jgi:hypothetical protein
VVGEGGAGPAGRPGRLPASAGADGRLGKARHPPWPGEPNWLAKGPHWLTEPPTG